ncbi:MAG: GNAT family N-acetyltransferase [Paracoccus sp. (in: a-proteobacteria)]
MMSSADSRPLGPAIPDWQPPARPGPDVIEGRYIRLERLDPARHAGPVFAATASDAAVWDYMSNGPFTDVRVLQDWMAGADGGDKVFYAFVDPATGRAFGYAAFMRIDEASGVLEIGHVVIAPAVQRSRAASEVLMAMIRFAFEAGYRRVEWKCNALNAASRRAARRYGFAFEGTFRQHLIIKGRSRDTAWFAMTNQDWPELSQAYAAWLEPENFDASGIQQRSLSSLIRDHVARVEAAMRAD